MGFGIVLVGEIGVGIPGDFNIDEMKFPVCPYISPFGSRTTP